MPGSDFVLPQETETWLTAPDLDASRLQASQTLTRTINSVRQPSPGQYREAQHSVSDVPETQGQGNVVQHGQRHESDTFLV